jgi:hypothetical protein
MANRFFTEFNYMLDKGVITLFVAIGFNGSGTPTLFQWNPTTRTYAAAPTGGARGISKIARNGTGDYTITLQDTYQRLLVAGLTFISNSNVAGPIYQVKVATNPNLAGSTAAQGLGASFNAVEILTFSAQGTAADPGTAELGILNLSMQNSSAL